MELAGLSIIVIQFIMACPYTYVTEVNKVVCAGVILTSPARAWYQSKVDPATYLLPFAYTLPISLRELAAFFGAGVTQATLERALTALRQTTTVAQFAIDFQISTNTFDPLWSDGPPIYIFEGKLKEVVQFQLTSQGGVPMVFQDYITTAIAV